MAYSCSNSPSKGHAPSCPISMHGRQALCFNSRTSRVSSLAPTATGRAPRPIKSSRLQCRAATEAQSKSTLEASKLKPMLPAEVIERRLMQQELELMSLRRANQHYQAVDRQREALLKKAVRVVAKGLRRSKETTSQLRLSQTKLDHLTRESDVPQLHATIEEKENAIQQALEEAERARLYEVGYKRKLQKSEEEREEAEYQARRAEAAKVEAQLQAEDLHLRRQQDLQWYQEAVNTTAVFGQFFFEMCVKALPLPPLGSSFQNSQKQKKMSNTGAANEKSKQGARFL